MSSGLLECLSQLVQRLGGLLQGLLTLLGIRRFLSLLHGLFSPLGRILDLCCCGIGVSGEFTFSFVSDGSRIGQVNKRFHGLFCCLGGFLLFVC